MAASRDRRLRTVDFVMGTVMGRVRSWRWGDGIKDWDGCMRGPAVVVNYEVEVLTVDSL